MRAGSFPRPVQKSRNPGLLKPETVSPIKTRAALSSGSLINHWEFEVAITKQRFDFKVLKIDRAYEAVFLQPPGYNLAGLFSLAATLLSAMKEMLNPYTLAQAASDCLGNNIINIGK